MARCVSLVRAPACPRSPFCLALRAIELVLRNVRLVGWFCFALVFVFFIVFSPFGYWFYTVHAVGAVLARFRLEVGCGESVWRSMWVESSVEY